MNKMIWVAAGALALGGGIAFLMAPQQADQTAGHSMTPPDTSGAAQGAAMVKVSLPDELSPNAQIGKRAFDAKCAACHNDNATGQNGVAPPLVHKIYEPGHHGDSAFLAAALTGVTAHHWNFGNMPPVEGITQADVKYIVAYVRELQRANGIN